MGKKEKEKDKAEGVIEAPVDLAARLGGRGYSAPRPVPPSPPSQTALPPRLDGPLPPRRAEARPGLIGMDEPIVPVTPPSAVLDEDPSSGAIPSPRLPPGPGETDLVVTPLPTLDDWHRFELALRKVRGVGQLRTEYFRHGVLKVRVSYSGEERLAHALRDRLPGYRVRIIGEDRSTVQLLVSSEVDERRPG